MMDFQSPQFLALEISGDNFRPNDVVAFDNKVSDRTRLKTQHVSSHRLRAWLPRESWRKHRVRFRLIVQCTAISSPGNAISANGEASWTGEAETVFCWRQF